MGIMDRDYYKKQGKSKDPYYDPKQFRGSRRRTSNLSVASNESSPSSLKTILFWLTVGTLIYLGIHYYQQNKRLDPAEMEFPQSGTTILYQPGTDSTAKLTVISEDRNTDNCIVKLEDWRTGVPVLELFIKAEQSAEVPNIPLGEYRVKTLCGNKWYGRAKLFGANSTASISETSLIFYKRGDQYFGHTLNLNHSINGNFKTVPLSSNSF
jgi:hypothetical protein